MARQSDLFSLNWVNRARVDRVDYSLVEMERSDVKKNRRFLDFALQNEQKVDYDFYLTYYDFYLTSVD